MSPLVSVSRPLAEPPGYLMEGVSIDVDGIDRVTWTLRALGALSPSAFLAAPLTTACLASLISGDATSGWRQGRLLPILESARTGRRLADLSSAREAARRAGLRVALTGHRIAWARGFDAIVVDHAAASIDLRREGSQLLIASGICSPGDVTWAERIGADLMAGPDVADPIRVAPVDVTRLRERRSDPVAGPSASPR